MDPARAPHSGALEDNLGVVLSDEDVISSLLRGQAVQKDVEEALASIASALSSASSPGVVSTLRRRFHERAEACGSAAKAAEEARVEREGRIQADKARSEIELSLRDEATRQERALQAAEKGYRNIQNEAKVAAATAEEEIARLKERTGVAEKDAREWQQKAEAGVSRLESVEAEVGALHEAMAGLHGEMGAVQRELDGAKASQDKLTKDLAQAEGNNRRTTEALSATVIRAKEAERRLRKEIGERERVSVELAKVSDLKESEMAALAAEVEGWKESETTHRITSDKLNSTNRDLNALLQSLSADLEGARTAAEIDAKRADTADAKVREKEEEMRRLGGTLAETESRLAESDRERVFVKDAVSKTSADLKANLGEVERQRGELDLLEREKRDLILDVQERVRALKEATTEAEKYQERVAEAEKLSEGKKTSAIAAESREKKALDDLSEARRATAMQDERIEALRSELSALKRTLEQTSEGSKARDRENAQRLVQVSQVNAKLSSEGASARALLADAEDAAEKTAEKLQDVSKALEKSGEEGRRAAESVQRLEEELEVADARWKAAQGQLAAADRREKRAEEDARQRLREALESKNKEVDAALREAETNAQRRFLEAEASQRAAERVHERALATARDEAKTRLAGEEARRIRDVSEAKRKSKAAVSALQALHAELRNSEAKGVGLERQVSQLSARVNRAGAGGAGGGNGGRSARTGSGTGSEVGSVGGGGDSARGTEIIEAEIASLRRQMRVAIQGRETAEKGAVEARSRAEDEGKRRSSLEEALCRKEGDLLAALGRLNTLKIRLQEVEESSRDTEEDLRGLVRQRESEIEQLERRNQVLSEALTRLTSSDADSDGTHNPYLSSTTPGVGAETSVLGGDPFTLPMPTVDGREREHTGTAGSGFPAIPKLGRGRDLAVSLGESWKSAPACALSPTMGGGDGTSLLGPEASLSVLVDSSAGFEPPAPPSVDPHSRGEKHLAAENSNDLRSSSSSSSSIKGGTGAGHLSSVPREGYAFADIQRGGGRESESVVSTDTRSGVRGSHGGHSGESGHQAAFRSGGGRYVTNERAVVVGEAEENTSVLVTKTGDNGVLRGLSAAMTSGALPATQQQNAAAERESIRRRRERSGDRGESDHPRPQGKDGAFEYVQGAAGNDATSHGAHGAGGGEGRDPPETRSERGSSIAGGGDGLVIQPVDDGGEQARRHIDQALRERALRRRHSEGEVAAPKEQQDSSILPRVNDNKVPSAVIDGAFPSLMRSGFRVDSNALSNVGEEPRFINLDAVAQRARSVGSKQGLPGRGGSRASRARSTVASVATRSTVGAAKKNTTARVYGMPRNSR